MVKDKTLHHYSPLRLAINKLKKNKIAMVGVYILSFLYLSAILADFIAPYSCYYEDRTEPYHPPTPIHFFHNKKFYITPFVYDYKFTYTQDYLPVYIPKKDKIYPIKLFYKGEEYKLFGLIKTNIHLFGVDKPVKILLFGADHNGRCIFSRILFGGRVSLTIGILAVLISFSIGMLIGGIAGYFGGLIDNLLMRIVEVIMCFPSFYLLLALRAAFPLDLSSTTIYILIVLIMSFIGWASLARVIRGIVLSIKEREYVLAAKAMGKSSFKIILSDILPNTASYVVVAATLSIPMYILSESALSVLGLGIIEPQPSWGNMLTKAMNISDMTQHPWILIPGFFIFLTVLAYNLLGDGLRDAFDPKTFI